MLTSDDQLILREHLEFIYERPADALLEDLNGLLAEIDLRYPNLSQPARVLDHSDTVLITYADQVQQSGKSPLTSLRELYKVYLKDAIGTIHLLPFFPYSSDDGFSVIDYLKVDPESGSWQDVVHLAQDSELMFDAVVNHISAKSDWFQAFLADQAPYSDFFICESPDTDLSAVVRPRTSALLSEVSTPSGRKHVWTTFSSDQVDLNYANPVVLFEMTGILLDYAARGARIIRLDAITYLWKEVGTSCVHHAKTHRVLQFWRSLLKGVAPQVILLTETNVPHSENISYFGNGKNEAHMVYNFALPPLVLHTLSTGQVERLREWASHLRLPSKETTFFNFLASHDGTGVRPVENILNASELTALVDQVQRHGGLVSYKTNSDGSQSPYELNINYFDALNNPDGHEAMSMQIDRFVCAHAIMMALQGVPAIYVHSLLGSRSYHQGVTERGYNRAINREKFNYQTLSEELNDPEHRRRHILQRLTSLFQARRAEPAFDPYAAQEVLDLGPQVFALRRFKPNDRATIYALHNISAHNITLASSFSGWDLVQQKQRHAGIVLKPYEVCWLRVTEVA